MVGYSFSGSQGTKATDFQYKFELKPIYESGSVRLGSEAAKVGCYKVILLFQLIQRCIQVFIKDK
jgi:hypothetical protein